MPFGGLLTVGILGAGGSVIGGILGSNAASDAANAQVRTAEMALQAQQPWLTAGQFGLGQLMTGFQNGTFGPGAIPNFSAPTIEQARASPGYQFSLEQGTSAIDRSAAARGALGSGSTLKALQSFGTGLADSTYNDVFSRALSTYSAKLAGQAQGYNQLASLSQVGQTAAGNAGNLMLNMGTAQAGGILGSANALNQGISGATGNLGQLFLLNQLMKGGGFGGGGGALGLQPGPASDPSFGAPPPPILQGTGPG